MPVTSTIFGAMIPVSVKDGNSVATLDVDCKPAGGTAGDPGITPFVNIPFLYARYPTTAAPINRYTVVSFLRAIIKD